MKPKKDVTINYNKLQYFTMHNSALLNAKGLTPLEVVLRYLSLKI